MKSSMKLFAKHHVLVGWTQAFRKTYKWKKDFNDEVMRFKFKEYYLLLYLYIYN